MKLYSQHGLTAEKRVFNYHLSRTRRIAENAFGILSIRFRIFMTPINRSPEKVETITLACCALHNLLRTKATAQQVYMPPGSVDTEDPDTHTICQGEWHNGPQHAGVLPLAQRTKATAQQVYMPPGSVDTEDPDTHTICQGEWHNGPQHAGVLPLAQQGSNRHLNT